MCPSVMMLPSISLVLLGIISTVRAGPYGHYQDTVVSYAETPHLPTTQSHYPASKIGLVILWAICLLLYGLGTQTHRHTDIIQSRSLFSIVTFPNDVCTGTHMPGN